MVNNLKELADETLRAAVRRAELQEIMAEMDVPNMRRDLNKFSNLSWLKRNLLVLNGNHPQVSEALVHIRVLMRRERKVMFPKGSDAI